MLLGYPIKELNEGQIREIPFLYSPTLALLLLHGLCLFQCFDRLSGKLCVFSNVVTFHIAILAPVFF